jgi:hypothetical protein
MTWHACMAFIFHLTPHIYFSHKNKPFLLSHPTLAGTTAWATWAYSPRGPCWSGSRSRGQGQLGARLGPLRVVRRGGRRRTRRDGARVPARASGGQPLEGRVPSARRVRSQGERETA